MNKSYDKINSSLLHKIPCIVRSFLYRVKNEM